MQDEEDVEGKDEATEEQGAGPDEEATVEPVPETAEASPRKPTDEMKVVIIMKADKVMLGVQSPDCDPVYTTMKGSLSTALKKVPALVAEAKLKWEANPRYPKADLPEPPPSTARSQPAQTASTKPKSQPSFF